MLLPCISPLFLLIDSEEENLSMLGWHRYPLRKWPNSVFKDSFKDVFGSNLFTAVCEPYVLFGINYPPLKLSQNLKMREAKYGYEWKT